MPAKQQQAIVKIGFIQVLCPSVRAGSDLVALLSRCVEVDLDLEQYPRRTIYKQKPIKMEMEVVTMEPHKPEPKVKPPTPTAAATGRTMRQARARELPAPSVLELPWSGKEGC